MAKKLQRVIDRENAAADNALAAEISRQWMEQRFDTLESQNKEQLKLIADHVAADAKVHATVSEHTTYFSVLKWAFGALLPGGAIYAIWISMKP